MADERIVVHHTPVTGVIRVYTQGGSYEDRDPYDLLVCVHFLTDSIAYLWGAHGVLTPEIHRKGMALLKELGVKEIAYERRGRLKTRLI